MRFLVDRHGVHPNQSPTPNRDMLRPEQPLACGISHWSAIVRVGTMFGASACQRVALIPMAGTLISYPCLLKAAATNG